LNTQVSVAQKSDRWLGLAEARQLLGVNESTLRHWADLGKIRSFRTIGGHRRFFRDDIQSLLQLEQKPYKPPLEEFGNLALIRIRQRLRTVREHDEPWIGGYDEDSKIKMRLLGRQLLSLATEYLSHKSRRNRILEEAKVVASQYGNEMARCSLTLQDGIEGLFFFRNALGDSFQNALKGVNLSTEAAMKAFREINDFADQLLLAIVGSFEKAQVPDTSEGASRLGVKLENSNE